MHILKELTLRALFLAPMLEGIFQSQSHRICVALSDEAWLTLNIFRINGLETSGRSHLQRMANLDIIDDINRQTVEAATGSKRRLRLVKDVMKHTLKQLSSSRPDPFKDIDGLDGYDVYAADGHYHKPALFDKKIAGKKQAVQHFYALNLRTHGMSHLTAARIGDDADPDVETKTSKKKKKKPRQKENDIHALKRLSAAALRQGAQAGRKVIYVYDRALIDFAQWGVWKMQNGVYVISREKDGMNMTVVGACPYNEKDSINAGIISCDSVTSSDGTRLRRITQRLPETGEEMVFLTNEFRLEPGVIVYLYKRRWDIEKVYDVFKNKVHEKQAWGKSITTKEIQAHMICIHHNLTMLLEEHLDMESVQRDDRKRAHKRLKELKAKTEARGDVMPKLRCAITTITQHSKKLLGWLRACLELDKPLQQAIASLQKLLEATY